MDDDSDKVTVEGEILEETFHSFIVARPTADNKTVVVKQCRTRQNPWATVRWRDEVEILKVIALGHVCNSITSLTAHRTQFTDL